MICPGCGSESSDAARFCSACGMEISDSTLPLQKAAHDETTELQPSPEFQKTEVVQDKPDSLLGKTIAGKYRLDAKLGAGGMGVVYRSTRVLIGDLVAIKILHAEHDDPQAAERFRREARAAARLKHPNAVTIYDFGVTDEGRQYLVMDLVEGDSLRRIIKEQGPLTPSASGEIVNQVCAALDEAHRLNIVHRDIKPDNIMVRVAGGLRVKVLDFGIAKLRDDTAGDLTQTGSILGTPHYMSPEQCLGEELDSRSDIYSLGVVLYEMLTGIVPFKSPSSSGVVVQHVTQPPPSLRSLNPSIPIAVERVVLQALEKQRAARPQTAVNFAREFAASIASATRETPTSAGRAKGESPYPQPGPQSAPTVAVSRPLPGAPSQAPVEQVIPPSRKRGVLGYLAVGLGALTLGVIIVLLAKSGGNQPNVTTPNSPSGTPSGTPLKIVATASSVRLAIQSNTYDSDNAIDSKRITAWVEGVSGPGLGEWIQFDFDREITLHRMIVQPGYFKSSQIWTENNRLKAVVAHFSSGNPRELAFDDRMETQRVEVGAVRTKSVRLVIKSVYHGSNPGPRDDTALSEVMFEWEP